MAAQDDNITQRVLRRIQQERALQDIAEEYNNSEAYRQAMAEQEAQQYYDNREYRSLMTQDEEPDNYSQPDSFGMPIQQQPVSTILPQPQTQRLSAPNNTRRKINPELFNTQQRVSNPLNGLPNFSYERTLPEVRYADGGFLNKVKSHFYGDLKDRFDYPQSENINNMFEDKRIKELEEDFHKKEKSYFDFYNPVYDSHPELYTKQSNEQAKRAVEYKEAAKKLAKATLNKYPNLPELYDFTNKRAVNEETDVDRNKEFLLANKLRENTKEAKDIYDYYKSYNNSEGINRIFNNQLDNTVNKAEKENLAKKQQDLLDFRNKRQQKDIHIFNAEGNTFNSFYTPDYETGFVFKHSNPVLNNDNTDEFPYLDVMGHEIGHHYDYDAEQSKSVNAPFLDINKGYEENNHDEFYNERMADIWAIRYLLYNSGIYDSRSNENITPSQVKELRNKYPNIRIFRQMESDDDVAKMLNLVAYNDTKSSSNITALGGPLVQVANEFRRGGRKKKKKEEDYYAIMEKVAEENNPIWNKGRVAEGMRPLTVDEDLIMLLNDNSYDYRGYYDKYPNSKANADTHWTDDFKTAYHSTFSNESVYSGKKSQYNPQGIIGGTWLDTGDPHNERYEFSESQIENDWPINKTLEEFRFARDLDDTNPYAMYKGGFVLPEITITPEKSLGGSIKHTNKYGEGSKKDTIPQEEVIYEGGMLPEIEINPPKPFADRFYDFWDKVKRPIKKASWALPHLGPIIQGSTPVINNLEQSYRQRQDDIENKSSSDFIAVQDEDGNFHMERNPYAELGLKEVYPEFYLFGLGPDALKAGIKAEINTAGKVLQRVSPYMKKVSTFLKKGVPIESKFIPQIIAENAASEMPNIIRTVQDNGKIRLSLPTHTAEKPRQFVLEPAGDNKFYVHMRTWDGDHIPANLSSEDKQVLFNALYDELPDGAEILFPKSGPENYATRGTVAGLQRLARDPRFTPGTKGTLQYFDKDGKTIKTYEGTSFIKTPRITAENIASMTPTPAISFFSERPSKLTVAERLGIPKGDRGNLSQNQIQALEDLDQFIKSGQYRQSFRVTPDWEDFGWNLDKSNPTFIQQFTKEGFNTSREHMHGPWATVTLQSPTGKGNLSWNIERNMAGYSSRSFPTPEGLTWAPGEANMIIDGANGQKIILTAPKTDFLDNAVEEAASLSEKLANTIDKDIMKDFWINARKIQRPGTYLSGDNGRLPLGSDLIQAYKNKQLYKTSIFERPIELQFNLRTGLSPDSFSSIVRQGNRDNSLRWGEGFNKWNDSAVQNKHIYDAFMQLNKNEITPAEYEKIFNEWSLKIGGRPLQWRTFGDKKIPIHPHPYIYRYYASPNKEALKGVKYIEQTPSATSLDAEQQLAQRLESYTPKVGENGLVEYKPLNGSDVINIPEEAVEKQIQRYVDSGMTREDAIEYLREQFGYGAMTQNGKTFLLPEKYMITNPEYMKAHDAVHRVLRFDDSFSIPGAEGLNPNEAIAMISGEIKPALGMQANEPLTEEMLNKWLAATNNKITGRYGFSSKIKDKKKFLEWANQVAPVISLLFLGASGVSNKTSNNIEALGGPIFKHAASSNQKYNTFGPGGSKNLSLEEFLQEKRNAMIAAALNNSRTRTTPERIQIEHEYTNEEKDQIKKDIEQIKQKLKLLDYEKNGNPFINYYTKKYTEEEEKELAEELKEEYKYLSDLEKMARTPSFLKTESQRLNDKINVLTGLLGEKSYMYDGPTCINTATNNYGKKYQVSGNETFYANPQKYGFMEIKKEDMQPGDLIQHKFKGFRPTHMVVFDGYDENGNLRYNYSSGGIDEEAYKKNASWPGFFDDDGDVKNDNRIYRFIGTPQDIEAWTNEYNNIQASGGKLSVDGPLFDMLFNNNKKRAPLIYQGHKGLSKGI